MIVSPAPHRLSLGLALVSTLALALAVPAGCGASDGPVGPVSLAPASGSPVTLAAITVRPTTTFAIGASGVSMSSGDVEKNRNSVSVEYTVTAVEALPPAGAVGTGFVCQVGDYAVVNPFITDAALNNPPLAAGASKASVVAFRPTPLLPGMPSACEISFRYKNGLITETPVVERDLGLICWTPGALATGPCPAGAIRRVPPEPGAGPAAAAATAPIQITRVEAGSFEDPGAPSKRHIGLSFLATATRAIPSMGARLVGRASCERGGSVGTASLDLVLTLGGLAPGETMAGQATHGPLDGDPGRCSIHLLFGELGAPAEESAGSFCVDGEKVTSGACL